MATITSAATGNYNVGGTWVGGVAPTAADDVVIAASHNVTLPAATTVAARSMTVNASGTLTWAATTSVLNVGAGTAGTGNVAVNIAATATVTISGTGSLNLVSTSTTQQSVTTNGKTLPNLGINGVGGSWLMADALTLSGQATLSAGTFNTGGLALTATAITTAGASAGTFNWSGSTVTCTSTNTPISWVGTSKTMTDSTSSLVKATPTVNAANWGGATLSGDVQTNAAGSFMTTALTCRNLTVTGSASQAAVLSLGGNLTTTGACTVNGNSAVNRLIVQSTAVGTQRTITAASTSFTNSDFQDVAGAGAGSWNFSGQTDIGDRQGNSGITFPAAITLTRDATAGAWSTAARWTPSSGSARVPLPQDSVILNGSSGNTTTDVFCMGGSLNMGAYTATLTRNSSTTAYSVFGSITLPSNSASMGTVPTSANFELRGRGSHTITSNGTTFFQSTAAQTLSTFNFGGTYTTADALTYRGTTDATVSTIGWQYGTFVFSNHTHTVGAISSQGTIGARSIDLGAGTINFTSTAANSLFNINASFITTWTGDQVTCNVTTVSANLRQLVLPNPAATTVTNGWALGTVNYTVASSTGGLQISTTATAIKALNVGDNRTFVSTSGITHRFQQFNIQGTSGAVTAVSAVTAGTAWNMDLGYGGAPSTCNWATFKDVTVLTPWKLYATNSSTVSNVTGVHYQARTTEPYVVQHLDAGTASANITAFPLTCTADNLISIRIGLSGGTSPTVSINQSGYTKVTHSATLYTFWKVSDGTETQATFTITGAPSTQCAMFEEITGLGNNPSVNLLGTNTAASGTSMAALPSAGTSTASPPSWVDAFYSFNGGAGNSVSVTDGFDEGRSATQQTVVRRLGKPFVTASQSVNPTYTWTTSRVPTSYVYEYVYGNVAASSSKLLMFLGMGS